MCLILIQQAGDVLTEREIRDIHKRNPDGFGCAWMEGRPVGWRWMPRSGDDAIDAYAQTPWDRQRIYHWRYATHGPITWDMAHPFALTDGSIVAHNGVIHGYGSQSESDTAHFIRSALDPLAVGLDDPEVRAWVTEEIGPSSRLVLLRPDGSIDRLGASGVEWRGRWYSNTYAWDAPIHLRPWYREPIAWSAPWADRDYDPEVDDRTIRAWSGHEPDDDDRMAYLEWCRKEGLR